VTFTDRKKCDLTLAPLRFEHTSEHVTFTSGVGSDSANAPSKAYICQKFGQKSFI